MRDQTESYREEATNRLQAEQKAASAPPLAPRQAIDWRLAVNVPATATTPSGLTITACLHAIEHNPPAGRNKAAQLTPIHFAFQQKPDRTHKLLLAFEALTLAGTTNRPVRNGKLIYGDNHTVQKVNTAALTGEIRRCLEKIPALLSHPKPPELTLNRHCAECEFQPRCHQLARQQDELSLLAGMNNKERAKLHQKGIFTITQLSHTFQPRRKPKRLRDRPEKYHHPLKALAIREQKIHLVGQPDLKLEGTPVYLDVEGLPDRDNYYLIGLRIGDKDPAPQHSLWANNTTDEAAIWQQLLAILTTTPQPTLIHYGSYETNFLRQMHKRHGGPPPNSPAAKAIDSAHNLVSTIFARIYYPTYTNSLKEIAGYCGFNWPRGITTGIDTIALRETWLKHPDPAAKQQLIDYNTADCTALSIITQNILGLGQNTAIDTTRMKRENLYGFGRNQFFLPELERINKAAYWDYQRQKVYIRTNRRLKQTLKQQQRPEKPQPPDKQIECPPPPACPLCGSTSIRKYDRLNRTIHDLKFTNNGLRRWTVQYHFHRYQCRDCRRIFRPRITNSKFGRTLLAYVIYQNIELRLPQETIDRSLNRLYHLQLARGSAGHFKTKAAQTYTPAYQTLLQKLRAGPLLHADETKISVGGYQGCVWVFANPDTVAYVYTENRESGWLGDFLKDFNGILVSDFYAGYDALNCAKQRCLVHLLRDLNDDLHKHPYDKPLQQLGKSFATLVRPMIETVDRHGLKTRFLKKYQTPVEHFYRELTNYPNTGETVKKYQDRFTKNRGELFTFLQYDGIPWNNNNAEHAVKAFALLRQIINGVTTERGLREYLTLLSLRETCKYLGIDFLDFLRSGEPDPHTYATNRRHPPRLPKTQPYKTSPLTPEP
jgi:predicted RecB family nuclease